VRDIQQDAAVKVQVAFLKEKFQNLTQALVHGDLHTGSIMVTAERTQVIDAEFAFFGPMGFDIGALLANFFLSFYSQDGLATQDKDPKPDRIAYKDWLLMTAASIWTLFEKKFLELWQAGHVGDGFSFCQTPAELQLAQRLYMGKLWADTLGYAGIKMMRRIIGVAKVEDLKSIKDDGVRARCERMALRLGRDLVMKRKQLTLENVLRLVKSQDH